MNRNRGPRRRLMLILSLYPALLLPGCRACRSEAPHRSQAPAVFTLVPADARMVVGVEMGRLRASAQWPQVAEAIRQVLDTQVPTAELTARTGLDPLTGVQQMVLAAPVDPARRDQVAMALLADSLDETRLVSWARDRVGLSGRAIDQEAQGRQTMWRLSGPEQLTAFFPRRGQLVMATRGWAERLADAAVPARAPNAELMRLCDRARADRGVWFAVLLPEEVRKPLLADPRVAAAASILRLSGGFELRGGLRASLVAELSNSADARTLATQLERVLPDAKRHPQLLLMGLGPYLEAARIEAQGSNVHLSVDLSEGQLNDLLGRAVAFTRSPRSR